MVVRLALDRPVILLATLASSLLTTLIVGRILIGFSIQAFPSLAATYYDFGFRGSYPHRSYVSFPHPSPDPIWLRWHPSCEGGFIFLDVNGPAVKQHSPLILDSRGELVWMSDQFDTTMNSRLQTYRDETYLTFWAGRKAKASGSGAYFMLNNNYEVEHTVHAHGIGLQGDLHEFKITRDDTALITVYNLTRADLSSLGGLHSSNDWIVDSIFQEIDIATGRLLFQWRASDHFDASVSRIASMFAGLHRRYPLDFFHINSVEKDEQGNFLVSSRHLHSLVYIDGISGDVNWVLGGALSDFEANFDFHWQHDARWVPGLSDTISLFDNGLAWPQIDAPYSRGLMIHVDTVTRKAQMLYSYDSAGLARSSSQGSVQVLTPDDFGNDTHVFVGWGSSAVVTESELDGQLLCEMHFGASFFHFWERVKSYRAFKSPESAWNMARPTSWPPSLKNRGNKCFASWNGATTVASWELQGKLPSEEGVQEFRSIDVKQRSHFEEEFDLPPGDPHGTPYTSLRVVALDREDRVLDYSNIVSLDTINAWTWSRTLFLYAVILCVIGVGARHVSWTVWRR